MFVDDVQEEEEASDVVLTGSNAVSVEQGEGEDVSIEQVAQNGINISGSENAEPETLNEAPSETSHPTRIMIENEPEATTSAIATSESVENDLNTTTEDFVPGSIAPKNVGVSSSGKQKLKKKTSKGKKRKAAESVESADTEEGSVCTICFEDWSNSGDHRISSLRCGHFFGYSCIEKWLRGSGSSCPNCNEKSTKKDIRVHFVSRLAAIDTSERDRALMDLDTVRTELRTLQLAHTEMAVRLKLQQEKIEILENDNRRYRDRDGDLPAQPALPGSRLAAPPPG